MSTVKILIDKNSIKENPHGGSTRLIEYLPPTTDVTVNLSLPIGSNFEFEGIEDFINTKMIGCYDSLSVSIITKISMPNLSNEDFARVEEWINKNKASVIVYDYETKNNFIEYITHPQPFHFYDYVPTKISCSYCKAEFFHTELECNEDDDYYTEKVCPRCNTWDCCEIEYQALNEALSEKLNTPRQSQNNQNQKG